MEYDWNFAAALNEDTFLVLLRGFGMTMLITLTSILVATPLGIAFGVWSVSGGAKSAIWRDPLVRFSAGSARFAALRRWLFGRLIDLIRSIPLLLFVFMCFYGLQPLLNGILGPILRLFGLELSVPTLASVLFAFCLNLAAFIGDLVRGSLIGYSEERFQNGLAVGTERKRLLVWVVYPDILREIFPALINLYITIFKMTTLASSVAIYELLHSANLLIQQTYRPLEIYTVIAVFFIASSMLVVLVQHRIQGMTRFRRRGQ